MSFFRVLGAIVLAALVIGLAGAIFQTGYLAGVAADGAVPVVVGPGYGYGWHGWGMGWAGGIVGFFVFLFVIFIFLGILRAIFGGGRGGWGRGGWGPGGYGHDPSHRFGPWEQRAREAHDEWHRSRGSGGPVGSGGPGGSGTTGPSGGTNPNEPPSGGAA
jgi:hypothetical protein